MKISLIALKGYSIKHVTLIGGWWGYFKIPLLKILEFFLKQKNEEN